VLFGPQCNNPPWYNHKGPYMCLLQIGTITPDGVLSPTPEYYRGESQHDHTQRPRSFADRCCWWLIYRYRARPGHGLRRIRLRRDREYEWLERRHGLRERVGAHQCLVANYRSRLYLWLVNRGRQQSDQHYTQRHSSPTNLLTTPRRSAASQLVGLITRRSQVRILPALPLSREDSALPGWVFFGRAGADVSPSPPALGGTYGRSRVLGDGLVNKKYDSVRA
jgi:hypothetical protein